MTSVEQEPQHSIGAESLAIYLALGTGALGAAAGAVIGFIPQLPLYGERSLGVFAAIGAGVVSAGVAGSGYWRARNDPGQRWRAELSPMVSRINVASVVLVHAVLAVLAALVAFLVLDLSFVGLEVDPFWSATLMGVTVGLTAYLVHLSVTSLTTRHMVTLLLAFVGVSAVTAMVTAPDKEWWKVHFSHLGTFWSLSSLMFNGALVVGGLLVTTFAVYVANDMRPLVAGGVLRSKGSPRAISLLFVLMGSLLAGVGLVPVSLSLTVHNLCAFGVASMYLLLLVAGRWILRGMPRAYFVAAWAFLAATLLAVFLYASVDLLSLTAFEIVVFALVFGWISVFIRFLGVANQEIAPRAPRRPRQLPWTGARDLPPRPR